jgi:hypothetical protein
MCDTILHEGTEIETVGELREFLNGISTVIPTRSGQKLDDDSCLCSVDIPATAKAAGFDCVTSGDGDYRWSSGRSCKNKDGEHDIVEIDGVTVRLGIDLLAQMRVRNADAKLYHFPNRKPLDQCLCVVDLYRTAIKNGFACGQGITGGGAGIFQMVFRGVPESHAGKTLHFPGIGTPVNIVTDAEAEQSEWYVCGSERVLDTNAVAQCSLCGCTVFHSPLGPTKPKKICLKCMLKVATDEAELRVSPEGAAAIQALTKEQNESNESKAP